MSGNVRPDFVGNQHAASGRVAARTASHDRKLADEETALVTRRLKRASLAEQRKVLSVQSCGQRIDSCPAPHRATFLEPGREIVLVQDFVDVAFSIRAAVPGLAHTFRYIYEWSSPSGAAISWRASRRFHTELDQHHFDLPNRYG